MNSPRQSELWIGVSAKQPFFFGGNLRQVLEQLQTASKLKSCHLNYMYVS